MVAPSRWRSISPNDRSRDGWIGLSRHDNCGQSRHYLLNKSRDLHPIAARSENGASNLWRGFQNRANHAVDILDVHYHRGWMIAYLTEAQRLRKAIKAAGFTHRQVSVRAAPNILYVTIRDSSVTRSVIDRIAASNARAAVSAEGADDAVARARYVHRRRAQVCGTTLSDERDDRDLDRPRGYGMVGVGSQGGAAST